MFVLLVKSEVFFIQYKVHIYDWIYENEAELVGFTSISVLFSGSLKPCRKLENRERTTVKAR